VIEQLALARAARAEYRPRPRGMLFSSAQSPVSLVRGSLAIVVTNRPPGCRRSARAAAARFALAVALAAAWGCSMVSNTQNSEGVRMFDQAYYQGAQQRFVQAIQSDPNNPDGYYNLARTMHQLGKLHNQPSD